MTLKLNSLSSRALLATGLLFGAVAAQAAGGYIVKPSQEALVMPGMSMGDVQSALGRPTVNAHYRNEPGQTFTYHVVGKRDTVFDVDFGSDGKVASSGERMEELDGAQ